MIRNLEPAKVYRFLTQDFEDSWNSLSENQSALGRGNAMFAAQAMTFLEFTCRLCQADPTKRAISEFSRQLETTDQRYFLRIPGLSAGPRDFDLPYIGAGQSRDFLICALFDLIRNGLAHQYQQIVVHLRDGKDLGITLTGAAVGRSLTYIESSPRRSSNHLKCRRDRNEDLWITANPARLFLDFEKSFNNANLLSMRLSSSSLGRPDLNRQQMYDFTSIDLESLLKQGKSGGFVK